jgi:hypothetical protein
MANSEGSGQGARRQQPAPSAQPAGRAGRNRRRSALYLASDAAPFVTATDLLIEGGYVAFKGKIGP